MTALTSAHLRSRVLLLPLMVAVGVASGLVVHALSGDVLGLDRKTAHAATSGVLYTLAMWIAVLEAKRALVRRLPISGWRSASVHVGVLTAVASAAFGAIALIDPAVCALFGVAFDGPPPFVVIVGVALVLTTVVTTLAYLFEFYARLRDAEQARTQAELSALRAQINPHFLFNTLNSIAALIRIAPDQAEGVTERLADLFRYTLRASQHPTVALRDELAATRLYVEIEQARFRDRLVVSFDIEPDVLGAGVPSLLVQPLVENAVKHGVAQVEGVCAVRVRAQRSGEGRVVLEVRDTGPGFDTTDADRVLARGTGLANVRERLRLVGGPDATLTLLPDGVVLHFPLRLTQSPGGGGMAGGDGVARGVPTLTAAG